MARNHTERSNDMYDSVHEDLDAARWRVERCGVLPFVAGWFRFLRPMDTASGTLGWSGSDRRFVPGAHGPDIGRHDADDRRVGVLFAVDGRTGRPDQGD